MKRPLGPGDAMSYTTSASLKRRLPLSETETAAGEAERARSRLAEGQRKLYLRPSASSLCATERRPRWPDKRVCDFDPGRPLGILRAAFCLRPKRTGLGMLRVNERADP